MQCHLLYLGCFGGEKGLLAFRGGGPQPSYKSPLKEVKRTIFRENVQFKMIPTWTIENLRGAMNTSVIVCDIVEVWSSGQKTTKKVHKKTLCVTLLSRIPGR